MHRWATAVTAVVFALGAVPVFIRGNGPLARAVGADAAVRVVRFTAVGSAVSVRFSGYAGGVRTVSVPGGTVPAAGGYAPVPPGLYVVTVRSALPISPLLTLRVQPGAAYTVGVLVHAGTVQALVVRDDLTAPPPGSGRVRLVLAAAGTRRAAVALASGPVLADAAPFGTVTGYHTVRAGSWRVTVTAARAAGSGMPRRPSAVAEVAIGSGSLTTLVVVDAPSGGLAVRAITDAVGARRSPGGPVPAGGGGLAAAPVGQGGPSAAVTGVLDLLGVFALWAGLHALVAERRRRVAERGAW
jgi:Domain of unknown function (DUF4397)